MVVRVIRIRRIFWTDPHIGRGQLHISRKKADHGRLKKDAYHAYNKKGAH